MRFIILLFSTLALSSCATRTTTDDTGPSPSPTPEETARGQERLRMPSILDSPPPPQAPIVKKEVDRFKGTFTLSIEILIETIKGWGPLTLTAYSLHGTEAPPVEMYLFRFTAEADTWRYLEHHPLIFLVDGKPEKVESRHSGFVFKGGGVSETVSANIPADLYARLECAAELEGRISITEFKAGPRAREALALLRKETEAARGGGGEPSGTGAAAAQSKAADGED